MLIRNYQSKDLNQIAQLFYDTVHCVNIRDYSYEQLKVWAPGSIDAAAWDESLTGHYSLVAVEDGVIVGFGDIDETGYIDRLYVHKDYQGLGIAAAICDMLEAHAQEMTLSVHASITAKGFFEKRGYRVIRKQEVERGGVFLTNFVMEKDYIIRKMRTEEYPLLADFTYEAIFKRDDTEEVPRAIVKEPALKVYYENFGSLEGDYCLCAETNGKVIGAVWVRNIDGYGSIDEKTPEFAISIYKQYRGRGIGTALMHRMLKELKEAGCKKASLAVQKDNYAFRMYQDAGFQIIGENEEEFIMRIDL